MKKFGLVLLCALFSAQSVFATSCGTNCEYTLENGVLTIYGTGTDGAGAITTHPWKASDVTSVSIAEGITTIGSYAFQGTKLTEVTLPSTITGIDFAAFNGVKTLQSINIPSGVTFIGQQAFQNTALTSITLPEGVTSIGKMAFNGVKTLQSVTIPDSVTSIGAYAFSGATVSNIICSEENLRKYMSAGGGFTANAQIMCTTGKCEDALKNTKYANLINNIVKYVQEVRQPDGSINIYKHGKLIGFKNKRIYTVEEASKLSKDMGNTFRIRYK